MVIEKLYFWEVTVSVSARFFSNISFSTHITLDLNIKEGQNAHTLTLCPSWNKRSHIYKTESNKKVDKFLIQRSDKTPSPNRMWPARVLREQRDRGDPLTNRGYVNQRRSPSLYDILWSCSSTLMFPERKNNFKFIVESQTDSCFRMFSSGECLSFC